MKDKIRPIYSELQGYLSQVKHMKDGIFYTKAVWEKYHKTIKELNNISDRNYDDYRIETKGSDSDPWVDVLDYRTKLGGLIARLHGEFFNDEPPPFNEMPNTIIQQTQQQNVSFSIQLVLEIRDIIDKNIGKFPNESKEKTFLEKVKNSLASVSNISQLVTLLLKTGKDIGLTLEQIFAIFT